MTPKIASVCLTFNRPRLLGRVIECFLRQTYANRELVILDDLGQYPDQPSGDRWRVISVPNRFPTMGHKLNAAARLVSRDVDMIQTWDDDDLYLPWSLAAAVDALREHAWAQLREVLEWDGDRLTRVESFHRDHPEKCAHHGNWAWRVAAFWSVGGYPLDSADDRIADLLAAKYGPSADMISERFPDPGYAYSREPKIEHISALHPELAKTSSGAIETYQRAYDSLAGVSTEVQPATIDVGWDRDYAALEIPKTAQPRAW